MMSEIQKFLPADIPAVADLFMRIFRSRGEAAPESLKIYFKELYFNSPWNDGTINSLVARRPDGTVAGFIGAMPRSMMLGEQEIRVVVAGNHMVDKGAREPFAGSNLLKRLLDGPQDLTFTDSANEISRRLWEKVGAATLLNYSLRWVRVLRPLSYSLSLTRMPSAVPALRALLAPALSIGDGLGRLFVPPPDITAAGMLTARPLTASLIVSGFKNIAGSRPLRPVYESENVTWLLSMARAKEQFGELKALAISERDEPLGWYLYYGHRGDTAQVLQVAARPESMMRVLNHLFVSAYAEGCTALMGMLDPRFIREYHAQKCIIVLRDMYTVAHSRNRDVLRPLLAGEAFLSRLDGEWWTRLQGDRFT
jgi:hypothetical protein